MICRGHSATPARPGPMHSHKGYCKAIRVAIRVVIRLYGLLQGYKASKDTIRLLY